MSTYINTDYASTIKKQQININRLDIKNKFHSQVLYRVFDILFASIALTISLPIMLIIAFFIKINAPKDAVFFKQKRLGLNGKNFNLYKFRTMVVNAEEKLEKMLEENCELREEYLTFRKLKNDPRIIPFIGNFLRKTSLDELPQFINVLLGQMTIVGPRPYLENEFSVFSSRDELNSVTSVKPGITGYWQTLPARHDTTFEERVKIDMEYIKKKSFAFDLKIIANTFGVMVLRKGA